MRERSKGTKQGRAARLSLSPLLPLPPLSPEGTNLPLLKVGRRHCGTEQPGRQLPQHQLVPRPRALNVTAALVKVHRKHVDLGAAAAESDGGALQRRGRLCREALLLQPADEALPEL